MQMIRSLRNLTVAVGVAATLLAFAARVGAAGRFPYAAVVQGDGAEFRSGPGASYYATSAAKAGQAVEVYHEDGDWSAVRPPAGSHCWVAAKHVTLPATLRFQEGVDLASPVAVEIAAENVGAFIGSEVADDRDAVAVRLKAGERVWVLSAEQAGGQTWIKIAPPSGEFRWIETKLLRAVAKQAEPAEEPQVADSVAEVTEEAASDAEDSEKATLAGAEVTGGEVSVASKSPGQGAIRPAAPKAAKKPTAAANSNGPGRGFWTQLQALELELSLMVAKQPRDWRFDDIRRDAQNLYDSAGADEEFDAARYLLGKLAKFESVRRERVDLDTRVARSTAATNKPRASLAGPPPQVDTRPGVGTNGQAPAASPSAAKAAAIVADDRYDASGRLVAIPTGGDGAPPYAIVDERNNVRQYISPAPRVNLQAYVGRTVGITGVASPSPDSTRSHVVAQRIDVLDGPIRR